MGLTANDLAEHILAESQGRPYVVTLANAEKLYPRRVKLMRFEGGHPVFRISRETTAPVICSCCDPVCKDPFRWRGLTRCGCPLTAATKNRSHSQVISR